MATDTGTVVRGWLDAIGAGDVERLVSLSDDDIVYRNWALPTIKGTTALRKALGPLLRRGMTFEYVVHRMVADGGRAMTERHDLIGFGRYRVVFWVCGVHEVRDGRITLWHDRYDLLDLARGSLRGLLGLVGPPAQLPTTP